MNNFSAEVIAAINQHYDFLEEESLKPANFSGIDLRGFDFTNVNFNKANLAGADFSNSKLAYARFSHANCSGANFSGANCKGITASHANFSGANFSGANLNQADLPNSDFSGADFSDADLYETHFSGAKLEDAKFSPDLANLHKPELILEIRDMVIADDNTLDMRAWHTCDSTHCIAGWAAFLHPKGREMERLTSTYLTALLILGSDAASHFYQNKADATYWLSTLGK